MDKLLTPKQLSERLQVSPSTVYQWVHTEFVPCIRLGKCVRFDEEDVIKWLQGRKKEGRMTLKYDIRNL